MKEFYNDYADQAFKFYMKTDRQELTTDPEKQDWEAADKTLRLLKEREPGLLKFIQTIYILDKKPSGKDENRELRRIRRMFAVERGLRIKG